MKFGTKSDAIKEAQTILAALGYYNLSVDGKFGPGTQGALVRYQQGRGVTKIEYTLSDSLLERLKGEILPKPNKSFFDEKTIWDFVNKEKIEITDKKFYMNMIGIRKDRIFDNTFDDRLVVLYKNASNIWEFREIKWTTMPGTLGKHGVYDPITVLGITGVATLKPGTYKDVYTFVDTYRGWLNYPYWQQTGNLTIYRDGNKNDILEDVNPQQTGTIFGINIHRMSNNGVETNQLNSAWVSWSIGCQGAPEPTFKTLLPYAREHVKNIGNKFTYHLVELG